MIVFPRYSIRFHGARDVILPLYTLLMILCTCMVECHGRWDDAHLKYRIAHDPDLISKLPPKILERYLLKGDVDGPIYDSGKNSGSDVILDESYMEHKKYKYPDQHLILSNDSPNPIKKADKSRYDDLLEDLNYNHLYSEMRNNKKNGLAHSRRRFKKRQVDSLGGSLIAGASFFDDNKVAARPAASIKESHILDDADDNASDSEFKKNIHHLIIPTEDPVSTTRQDMISANVISPTPISQQLGKNATFIVQKSNNESLNPDSTKL